MSRVEWVLLFVVAQVPGLAFDVYLVRKWKRLRHEALLIRFQTEWLILRHSPTYGTEPEGGPRPFRGEDVREK